MQVCIKFDAFICENVAILRDWSCLVKILNFVRKPHYIALGSCLISNQYLLDPVKFQCILKEKNCFPSRAM
jgi:hypothetical protein